MDEEAMWKGIYDKLQEIKNNPPTEHEAQYVFNFDYSFLYSDVIRLTTLNTPSNTPSYTCKKSFLSMTYLDDDYIVNVIAKCLISVSILSICEFHLILI